MTERRQLGTILLESGRITQDDVGRVLEYQRAHGGFFGQALIALDVVSREEIDWALANQFDLPFIFPNADAVDREAAHLVPADWALAHLAVPIVRAGKTLTVVVSDPLHGETIRELRTLTGCDIEMALASASRIRELIHAVYAAQVHQIADDSPVSLGELIADAMDQGADRFGISIRGNGATGWWRTHTTTHRSTLLDGWRDALEEAVQPSSLEQLSGAGSGRVRWAATLKRTGTDLPLEAEAMTGAGGAELLFRPVHRPGDAPLPSDIKLPPGLVRELRMLWSGGSARIGVGAAQTEAARTVLPMLPALSLGEHVRAAHVAMAAVSGNVYTLLAERDVAFAESVADCEFDAVTIDLPATDYPVRELLRAAPLAFMLLDEPEERAAPGSWGLNWLLTITGQPGSYTWDLRALQR